MSHLGLVTALSFATKNHNVLCLDFDQALIDSLLLGNIPIEEPDFLDLFDANKERIAFSTDFSEIATFDLIYITQDVITNQKGESSLAGIYDIVNKLSEILDPFTYVVILSQVSPGFTRELSSRHRLKFVYQVETLVFGQAVNRALYPERYIVGVESEKDDLSNEHRNLLNSFNAPVIKMKYESAELSKLAINLLLASSVTTTNSLAEICETIGASWNDIACALRLDRRIGKDAYLSPGLGISGGNLERDISNIIELARVRNSDTSVFESFQTNSVRRKLWPARILKQVTLANNERKRIAVWGLAYKSNTNSIKNSPSVLNIQELMCEYEVHVSDPVIQTVEDLKDFVTFHKEPLDCLEESVALLVLTNWPIYSSINIEEIAKRMKEVLIIDPYGVFSDRHHHIDKYFTLGRK